MVSSGPLNEMNKSNASSSSADSKAAEVPIFLRKTYHMINTCDENVASWGEDGTTFVVKNPDTFEKVIIPQFFKHSKFSSFVRQLNFYGFRKIKFADTIRINTALEQKTANFWRFRHENFRKGREDLLIEIKRSNSNRPSNSTSDGRAKGAKSALKGSSGKPQEEKKEEVKELKNELDTLKSRIAQMTSNIDELTELVHNVTLKEKSTAAAGATDVDVGVDADPVDQSAAVGNKRKKVQVQGPVDMVIDAVATSASAATVAAPVPSSVPSATVSQLDEITFNPSAIFPSESVLSSENSESATEVSDEAFVDELFNAFGDDDMDIIPDSILSAPVSPVSVSPVQTPIKEENTNVNLNTNVNTNTSTKPNAPDEKMMNNLSDALTLLPKNMQELLVNRLITTITSSDALKSHLDSLDSVVVEKKETTKEATKKCIPFEQNPDVALPLAAATLTALMTQFSVAMKDKKNPVLNKSLPVIPIHA